MATLYKKQNPHLFDRAINAIEEELSDRVAWLNKIFGNAERLIKQIDGVRYYTPNWYNSDNDYTLLAPDSRLGNFAFFVLDEPIDLDFMQADRATCTTPFSLIVWGDMRTIAADRDKELAKQDILQALATMRIREGRFTINRIYEKAENVFEGFTFDEIENQFLMHPFAGWRFEGEMTIKTDCIAQPTPTYTGVISGHVTDSTTTFTFTINGTDITVSVDSNGNWSWQQNQAITLFSVKDTNFDTMTFTDIDTDVIEPLVEDTENYLIVDTNGNYLLRI